MFFFSALSMKAISSLAGKMSSWEGSKSFDSREGEFLTWQRILLFVENLKNIYLIN